MSNPRLSAGPAIPAGHYAKKQLLCPSRLIAWSHRSRFRLARRLVAPWAGRALLDYGCGDGTFIAQIGDLFPHVVGADYDAHQLEDCRLRFTGRGGVGFVTTAELASAAHEHAYAVVTCMEVLEHCTESQVAAVMADLKRLAARDGVVIISVPIETGPALAGKQIMRALAGRRGLGDYASRERYRPGEFLRMVFAGARTAIERPVYMADVAPTGPREFCGHKGFNWRALRLRLERDFRIVHNRFSPLGWLGGALSSQAWFICEPR